MEHTGEKHMKLEKLIKYGKKLKKMIASSRKRDDRSVLVSPPQAVHCDELFKKSGKCKGDEDDLVLATYILAQNHFSLRPNIYI
ncbi:hypothetical protein FRX31_008108 [Thalictrum thalictroides]|uniref:Uncharacterized protein n=1 Tax=Thalictrum thalictroides TaxID=46969 RepID=A0A7J6X0E5_THATH|nr:hypothetical protein FRX31_008108 [Thalictrum thalictroides]